MWKEKINISGVPSASFRSLNGYENESIAIGRAMAAGYNLFLKANRD